MRMLEIIAGSWPLATMFIACLVAIVALYVIGWWKRSDQEDKAYRASQAVVVRRQHGDD